MRRAVIDDPEDAIGRAIRLAHHHFRHQPAERHNAYLGLTATHYVTPADVPGGQVLQRAASFIFELDSLRPSRSWSRARVAAAPSLDACLLVSTNDVILGAQRLALPLACVEIEDDSGLLRETGVAGEDPVLVPPGFDRIAVEDAPNGAPADGLAKA